MNELEKERRRQEMWRNLQGGVIAYVVGNALLVAVWAMSGDGYFWPAWVLVGWACALVLGVWSSLLPPVDDGKH